VPGVTKAAEAMLAAVPGITLVDLGQPGVGLQSSSLSALPELRREMQLRELEAAEAAGVDAIVAVYHTDHRELCAHERGWPFRILNVLEIVADSMGVGQHDRYKELKLMQEADRIIADCAPLIDRHRIDPATAHDVVVAMLKEQPVPLRR